MTGPEALGIGIGVGLALGSLFVAYHAVASYRREKRKLRGPLEYWQRVFAREAASRAVGDMFLAGFGMLMAALCIGMGLSGILLS